MVFLALWISDRGLAQSADPSAKADYVWTDALGVGRLQAAYFRYELTLEGGTDQAEIHLFADSRYHLLVNGAFVHFGPARFYPEHPEYDRFDLAAYLRPGKNVIAVRVLSNGVSTFQLRRNQPGFIAWGTVTDRTGATYDLSTPGDWKAYRVQGYDEDAPRMTFALGPMEVYDARKDQAVQGWEGTEFDATGWDRPVKLDRQDAWGALTPRSIPPLTAEIHAPRQLLGVYDWEDEEEIYQFQLLKEDRTRDAFRESRPFFGYTYIYSPVEQTVGAGIWWGEHYLNGEGPLEQQDAKENRPVRQQATLHLRQGWNYFFVRRKSFFGKWSFLLALPKDAGLQLSPDRDKGDSIFFRTTGALPEEAWEAGLSMVGNQPSETPYDWMEHRQSPAAGNPAMEMAWRYFEERRSTPDWQIDDITLTSTDGVSLVYDFRYKKLGRIIIDYEAPAGTIIDVGMTEDLHGEQVNIMKRNGLYMTTRHIAAGGAGRLETFKPYGFRFLQLNVKGNDGPVRIKKVRVMQHVYPFERVGQFKCSDPTFNEIWSVGWRTLQVCAEDSYTDTPFRERGLYAGDMLPQMGVTLAGAGDLRLIKRSLRLFQDMYVDQFNPGAPKHPDEIGLLEDYPLLTLEALSWYVDRTGDLAFAAELYPAYERLLGSLWEKMNEDGLIHNERVFIEWTRIEKSDVSNTAYHAMLVRSCDLMARLADQLQLPEKHRFYQNKRRELARHFQDNFWDETSRLYVDGIKNGERIDHHFPISSVWPYLTGLTDAEMNESIFDFIAEELKDIGEVSRHRKTTPYGSFYVLGALYDYGRPDVAERFIRQYWRRMIYRHNDTAWENFDDVGIGTLSHAWSGAPTYYMMTQVLGVELGWPRLADPDRLVLAPQSATLNWARGVVPHPRGRVKVFWEIRGDLLWVECEAPEGVEWSVQPKGRLGELRLWVNGRPQD